MKTKLFFLTIACTSISFGAAISQKVSELPKYIVNNPKKATEYFFAVFKENKKLLESLFNYAFMQKRNNVPNSIDLEHVSSKLINILNKIEIDLNYSELIYSSNCSLVFDALRCAIFLRNYDLIKILISKGAEVNNLLDFYPPLGFAFNCLPIGKHETIFKLFLESKSDLNLQNKLGVTPLYSLAINLIDRSLNDIDSLKIFSLMLQRGADFELKNYGGYSVENYVTSEFTRRSLTAGAIVKLIEAEKMERIRWKEQAALLMSELEIFNKPICKIIANLSNRH